jgi:hypothetical protein
MTLRDCENICLTKTDIAEILSVANNPYLTYIEECGLGISKAFREEVRREYELEHYGYYGPWQIRDQMMAKLLLIENY